MIRQQENFFSMSKEQSQNPCQISGNRFDFSNPDPFVLRYLGTYYCYSTGDTGVNVLTSQDMVHWEHRGLALKAEGQTGYWAPSVIYRNGKFYLYYSSCRGEEFEWMRVASSNHPLGPFHFERDLSACFSIDTHAVRGVDGEYYLFYCTDNACGNRLTRPGTSVLVDRLIDPVTLEGKPELVLAPTIYQEISGKGAVSPLIDWHTVEGVFYLRHQGREYLMYSGNSFEREDYFLGYAVPSRNADSIREKVWTKYPANHAYQPFCRKNEAVEGTGHNSSTKAPNMVDDWCVYHARLADRKPQDYRDCRLLFTDRILWDQGNMWLAGPSHQERDAPALPSFTDEFLKGLSQWEVVSGDWSADDGKAFQNAVDVPARLRMKQSFQNFVMEAWVKTDFQPHGSLLGMSLYQEEETLDFLLHEGLRCAQIIRWRGGIRIKEKVIPLEKEYAPFAWHCIRLERSGNDIRFLLDDFELAEIPCMHGKVFPELYTQLCKGKFSAVSLTQYAQAQGERLAELLQCETVQGIFEGNEEGIHYFTNKNAKGKFTVRFDLPLHYEASLDVFPYSATGDAQWKLWITKDTAVTISFEKGRCLMAQEEILLDSGHTIRVKRIGEKAIVLLDRQCIYHGIVQGLSYLSLQTDSCLCVSNIEVVDRT